MKKLSLLIATISLFTSAAEAHTKPQVTTNSTKVQTSSDSVTVDRSIETAGGADVSTQVVHEDSNGSASTTREVKIKKGSSTEQVKTTRTYSNGTATLNRTSEAEKGSVDVNTNVQRKKSNGSKDVTHNLEVIKGSKGLQVEGARDESSNGSKTLTRNSEIKDGSATVNRKVTEDDTLIKTRSTQIDDKNQEKENSTKTPAVVSPEAPNYLRKIRSFWAWIRQNIFRIQTSE